MDPFMAGMMTPLQRAQALNAELAQERNKYYQWWVNADNQLDKTKDALEEAKTDNAKWAKYAKKLEAQIAELKEENDKFKKDGFRLLRQIREQNAKIEGLEGYENAFKRVSIVKALDNLILANVNAARSVLAESN